MTTEQRHSILRRCIQRQRGVCPVCRQSLTFPVDLHHQVANTKTNRKLYPHLIDHPIQLAALHHGCHMANPSWGRKQWGYRKAAWMESRLSAAAERVTV